MDTNSETDAKVPSTPTGSSDSSDLDENDDTFFNELFTGAKPTYVSADSAAPWLDDSDTETSDTVVKFYINEMAAVAEIAGTRHRIGFLDLTDEEYSCLGAISETSIEMSVNKKYILMHNHKFSIKRIQECEKTLDARQLQIESSFEELNLRRIQFSSGEPFLAKYQDDIYFVGKKLCLEYLLLLNRTKKSPGTSIRINRKRLNIDRFNQILDVNQTIDFKKPNEICIIADTNDSCTTSSRVNYPVNGDYRRFVMSHNTWTLLEVEPNLIHSSIYDDCAEIYAELNFPFNNNPKTKTVNASPPAQTEKLSRKEKRRQRAIKHEEKLKQNELDKGSNSPEVANKSNVETKNEPQSGKAMRTLVFSNSSHAKKEPSRLENGPFQVEELKPYEVSDDVKEYLTSGTPLSFVDRATAMTDKIPQNRMVNYLIASDLMIELEEAEHARHLEMFDQKNVRLTYTGDNQRFSFPFTDELSELVAEIESNSIEYVILRPKNLPDTSNHKNEHFGKICDLQDNNVFFDVLQPKSFNLIRGSCENKLYEISFKLNRLPYQLQHYALEFVLDHELFVRLIDNSDFRCAKPQQTKRVDAKVNRLKNRDETLLCQLNDEQFKAVTNILFSSKSNLPHLLIGAAGTGKTHTLVALIEQIVRKTKDNILFCAPTNAACDEMTHLLTRILQAGELYRFYATSNKFIKSKQQVLDVSNFTGTTVSYPPLKTLYKYRVVICTLESAGFLTRARNDNHWNGQNFKYVVIDDCATVHETMTFIPIAGLCTSKKKIHAKVILSGDLKQLGPITRSRIRIEMGYNKSWLAYLCRTKLYSRNEETGKLNDSFITFLDKNYRSHPQILHIPNELCYENAIQSLAKTDDINWYLDSAFLPSKKFPLIFKAIHGECQHAIGHNYYNKAEIDEVVATVSRLLPPKSKAEGLKRIPPWQIGIVTPYHTQNYKIIQALRAQNMGKVEVGTAKSFHSKQKAVIIISTVRSASEPFHLEVADSEIIDFVAPFAKSEWLNTAITRANCLVVIIGDPQMLKQNTKWSWLIERCIQHGSFLGDHDSFYS